MSENIFLKLGSKFYLIMNTTLSFEQSLSCTTIST